MTSTMHDLEMSAEADMMPVTDADHAKRSYRARSVACGECHASPVVPVDEAAKLCLLLPSTLRLCPEMGLGEDSG